MEIKIWRFQEIGIPLFGSNCSLIITSTHQKCMKISCIYNTQSETLQKNIYKERSTVFFSQARMRPAIMHPLFNYTRIGRSRRFAGIQSGRSRYRSMEGKEEEMRRSRRWWQPAWEGAWGSSYGNGMTAIRMGILCVGRPARRAVRASHEPPEPSREPCFQWFSSTKPSLGSVRFSRAWPSRATSRLGSARFHP
jgi:hypothetical protein